MYLSYLEPHLTQEAPLCKGTFLGYQDIWEQQMVSGGGWDKAGAEEEEQRTHRGTQLQGAKVFLETPGTQTLMRLETQCTSKPDLFKQEKSADRAARRHARSHTACSVSC